MRDIDPIRNPSEALLSAALNRLAKGSARQAPASVGIRLEQEFRRYRQRRRMVKGAVVFSLAACLALVIAFLLTLRQPAQNAPSMVRQPAPAVVPGPAPQDSPAGDSSTQHRASTDRQRGVRIGVSRADNGFMPLDTYDPAMEPAEVQVVRLELTGADLRLVGAPVAEELSDQRLLADIVVDRDGTPYAVRLVR